MTRTRKPGGGRKRRGIELRVPTTVRMEPWKKKLVIDRHGSIQKFFDEMLDENFETPHEAVIVRREKVSINDF